MHLGNVGLNALFIKSAVIFTKLGSFMNLLLKENIIYVSYGPLELLTKVFSFRLIFFEVQPKTCFDPKVTCVLVCMNRSICSYQCVCVCVRACVDAGEDY
jgi:hypothetical protein